MPVPVERDRDRRVAEVGAQGLGIQSGGDADAGVGMTALVEAERVEVRLLPACVGTTAQDAWVGRPLGVVGTWEEEAVARVVEQDEMVGQRVASLSMIGTLRGFRDFVGMNCLVPRSQLRWT